MEAKVSVSTGKETVVSVEMTLGKIGELLARVPESDLPKVAEAFMQSRGMVSKHPEDVAALFFNACVKRGR